MAFVDDGAPNGDEVGTADDGWRSDFFSSRYEPFQGGTSSLDLLNRQPLLCSTRDLGNNSLSGEYGASIGFGATGALGLLLVGPGIYVSAGFNAGVMSSGIPFLQVQAAVGVGIGSYIGFGVQGGGSSTDVPTAPKLMFGSGTILESNVGWGPSFGGSYQTSSDGKSLQGGIPKLPERFGEGVGAHASVGVWGSVTVPLSIPPELINMPWAP